MWALAECSSSPRSLIVSACSLEPVVPRGSTYATFNPYKGAFHEILSIAELPNMRYPVVVAFVPFLTVSNPVVPEVTDDLSGSSRATIDPPWWYTCFKTSCIFSPIMLQALFLE